MLKNWIQAARLRTLPLAIACIGTGGFLAASKELFEPVIFGLTLLTAFLLQVLSNFANDYGDSQNGADSEERVGPSRAVQTGAISSKAMRNAVIIFAILSFLSGVSLLYLSLETWEELAVFLGMGILSVIAAITYTMGNNPYGYAGFGDISVLLFFGLLAVGGTYYLQAHQLDWQVLLPATSLGLFATGVLNVNNIRDIESDVKAGKYSIPVRLGRKKAVVYHWTLLGFGWVCSIVYLVMNYENLWQLLFVASLPLFIINAIAVRQKKTADALDPYLKQMAISTLIFSILFGMGQIL
ncbi:MAG: 1,4-dihydroxy-2-naphthoate polyprenyltransferase [Saprospiraceae bacterium]